MLKPKNLFAKFLNKKIRKPVEQVFVDSQKCRQLIREQYTIRYHNGSPAPEVTCEPLSDPKVAVLKLIAVAFSETIPNLTVKRQKFIDLGVVRDVEWHSGGYEFKIKASIRTTDKWEQGFAKSTTHLRINGQRCFSGSLYRFDGMVMDGSIHNFGNISYLRTPLDWLVQVNGQSIPASEAIFGCELGGWDEFLGRHIDWTSRYKNYSEK